MRISHGSIVLLPKNVNYRRSDKEMHNRRFKINTKIPNIFTMLKQRHTKIKKIDKKTFLFTHLYTARLSASNCA